MFDFNEARLESCIIHGIGNKSREEELVLAEKPVNIEDEFTADVLVHYFTVSFKRHQYFHLEQQGNEVYGVVESLFGGKSELVEASQTLAEQLYNLGEHPRIKSGELYVARLSGCKLGTDSLEAIGIFKSENKDTFLKINLKGRQYEASGDSGININKLDKGCIIFNTEKDQGYRAIIVDNATFGDEARFWKEEFLKVKPAADDYNITANFVKLCKGFCDEVLTEDNQIEKKDQLLIKNKTLDYFKKNETFNTQDFANEVIAEPAVVEAFHEYKQNFFRKHNMEPVEEVEISDQAVKNNGRFLKSVIKLDRNFHVYVHGRHEYLEKGFDEERNMHYYRLFFKEETT